MVKNSNSKSTNESEDTVAENTSAPARTDSIDVGPDKGGNLVAAWRGIFHLFGGRAEGFDMVDGGIAVRGFSVVEPYNPSTVLKDVSGRDRRVDLADGLPVIQGKEPAPFTESLEMTKWMQQYTRTPGEDGKSPQYVKDAISEYKKAHGFPGRRGRPKKVIRIENLGKLDAAQLAQVNDSEIAALIATLNQVQTQRAGETTEVTS